MGIVEKLVSSYGFVKCLTRDARLFFHYSSYQNSQNELKQGDLVEFEESIDKRNGKLIAVNLVRHDRPSSANLNGNFFQQQPQQQANIDPSINLMNLKELLLKNSSINSNLNSDMNATSNGSGSTTPTSSNQMYNQQQNNYQYLMNGLKMLNIQQSMQANNNNQNANGQYVSGSFNNEPAPASSSSSSAAVNNLNSIMSLFNKDTLAANSKNQQQTVINSNLLNMAKAAVAAQSAATLINTNGLSEIKKSEMLGNELMEGTIAIAAIKRPVTNNNYVRF